MGEQSLDDGRSTALLGLASLHAEVRTFASGHLDPFSENVVADRLALLPRVLGDPVVLDGAPSGS